MANMQDTFASVYTTFCGIEGHWEYRGPNSATFVKDTQPIHHQPIESIAETENGKYSRFHFQA
jgi:hypothetical protein